MPTQPTIVALAVVVAGVLVADTAGSSPVAERSMVAGMCCHSYAKKYESGGTTICYDPVGSACLICKGFC